MTPLDEAPEHRWRRTVDRRNRPAKLKVDRLLRDFGYDELDAAVGDAIEARLAGVELAVAPSLRDAAAGEVVTIYADETAGERLPPPPAASDPAPHDAAPAPEPEPEPAPDPEPAPAPAARPRSKPRAVGDAAQSDVTDVAQMVAYLKQEVLDARAESDRLRTELDRAIAARTDGEVEAQAIIADQSATLQEQSRQLAELGAALEQSREALAETRDEIRRAVGELQALPEPEVHPQELSAEGDDDLDDEPEPGGAEPEPGGAELYGVPAPEPEDQDVAWAQEIAAAVDRRSGDRDDELLMPAPDDDAPALRAVPPLPVLPLPVLDDPAEEAPAAEAEATADVAPEPVAEFDAAALDLDEPPAGADSLDLDEPPVRPDPLDLDEPPARPDPLDLDEPPVHPDFDLGEPPLRSDALDLDEPRVGPDSLELDDVLDLPPAASGEPAEPESWVPAQLREPAPEREPEADAALREFNAADLDPAGADEPLAPVSPEAGVSTPAVDGEPPLDDVADFDDFLYDPDELYDPAAPAGDAPFEDLERDPAWLDQPTSALPPPPPPPPSPWADEPEPELEAPAARDRPALGKVRLPGRGRGRWHGSCSICGRVPADSKRKDLEAAGWDLDDAAAACPQCRGIG